MKKSVFIILLLIVHLTLYIKHCSAQWYQINLPVSGQVHRMQFIDQNTGWLRMTNGNFLKSTNGGVNWQYLSDTSNHVYIFQFFNDTLGYATGADGNISVVSKSTNGGLNWNPIYSPPNPYGFGGMYFINKDTGWVDASYNPFTTIYIFRTTNGCQTFENLYNRSSQSVANQQSYLKFFKNPVDNQYYGYHQIVGSLYKTTNSGYNWTQIGFSESGTVISFSFLNKDTGWVSFTPNVGSNSKILFTSNSGQNWLQQFYSNTQGDFGSIQVFDNSKIWCGTIHNKILKTTNLGLNWGYQICPILPPLLYMYDTSLGFAWNSYQIVRTANGGGTIMSIEKISNIFPSKFNLKQNYPNPFNSETEIEFNIPTNSIVNLVVYDILGREIFKLINSREFSSGSYRYTLNLNNYNLSSGVYIYKMDAYNKSENYIFSSVKKLIYKK